MGRRFAAAEPGTPVTGEPDEAALLEFLRSAPPQLQGWARDEIAARRAAPAPDAEPADPEPVDAEVADADQDGSWSDDDQVLDVEAVEELDDDEDTGAVPRTAPSRGGGSAALLARRWLRSRAVVVIAGLAVVAGVVVGVYTLGARSTVPGISGKTTEQPAAGASTTPLDPAKVSALMTKISTNPRDITSLAGLGDLYFQAGDYKTAAMWEQKVLGVDPKNVTALLALGASEFNQGDSANAEKHWQQVVAIDERQIEAHYDLGFLYLSQNPPNLTRVRQEWNRVVQIDPNSQIAKTVGTHLASLNKTAGATAGPSAAPSASSGK